MGRNVMSIVDTSLTAMHIFKQFKLYVGARLSGTDIPGPQIDLYSTCFRYNMRIIQLCKFLSSKTESTLFSNGVSEPEGLTKD